MKFMKGSTVFSIFLAFISGCISDPASVQLDDGLYEVSYVYQDFERENFLKHQILIEKNEIDIRTLIYEKNMDGYFTILFDYSREVGSYEIEGDSLVISITASGWSCCDPDDVFDVEMEPDSSRYSIRIRNITDDSFELFSDDVELTWYKYEKK